MTISSANFRSFQLAVLNLVDLDPTKWPFALYRIVTLSPVICLCRVSTTRLKNRLNSSGVARGVLRVLKYPLCLWKPM